MTDETELDEAQLDETELDPEFDPAPGPDYPEGVHVLTPEELNELPPNDEVPAE